MFVRCHLPFGLDTGPGTRKSLTLCSLVLLIVATFLVCEVPGKVEEEIVGLGNHKRTDDKVELNPNTVKVTEKKDFNLTEYKYRFRDACNIKIEKGYIEIQYNEDGKGCIVDLLSTNEANKDKIKLTAGVKNKRGGIKKCLDDVCPFVYSVSNEDIERLNSGPNDSSNVTCKCKSCMPWTSLEILWSKQESEDLVYAHIYLIGEVEQGLSQFRKLNDSGMTFELEITTADKFTMNYRKRQEFNPKGDVCKIVKPEAWTITNTDFRDKRLFVFSLLSRNATFVFDGITSENPPYCDLFVQFKRPDYELLYVPPPSSPNTTTAKKDCTAGPGKTLETSTSAPCPTKSSTCPPTLCTPCPAALTLSSNNELMTTTAAILSSADPAENKCPEESRGWLYIVIAVIVVCVVIVGVLAWFWMKRHSEEKKLIVKHEEELYALYQAEEKVKGPKNMRSFEGWKVNRKHNELNELPYEKLAAAMWNRTDNKTPKEKMQFIVDQCAKLYDQEIRDREYGKEIKKRGRIRPGTFEGWKKRNNIITAFTVIDGTATAIEFDRTRDGEGVVVENVEEVKADENVEDGVSVPLSEGGGV
uniref:Uncharacterized protein n=1 Tax=Meloidogyne enterolobii TaxID=390850 RepID=A0A6V7YAV5_MELEN|nr:unnamed protein product [Meloidogyne enterolobii]